MWILHHPLHATYLCCVLTCTATTQNNSPTTTTLPSPSSSPPPSQLFHYSPPQIPNPQMDQIHWNPPNSNPNVSLLPSYRALDCSAIELRARSEGSLQSQRCSPRSSTWDFVARPQQFQRRRRFAPFFCWVGNSLQRFHWVERCLLLW